MNIQYGARYLGRDENGEKQFSPRKVLRDTEGEPMVFSDESDEDWLTFCLTVGELCRKGNEVRRTVCEEEFRGFDRNRFAVRTSG